MKSKNLLLFFILFCFLVANGNKSFSQNENLSKKEATKLNTLFKDKLNSKGEVKNIINETPDIQILSPDIPTNTPVQQFGYNLAIVKDINGDNIDDVVIGAPAANKPSPYIYRAGRVYIYFGGSSISFATPDMVLTGQSTSANFGASVNSAGDVNGDGYNDLIIGAFEHDGKKGKAYIYFGGTSFDATPDFTITGDAIDDRLGYSVNTAGDVNKDGYDDFLIGVRGHDTERGKAYLFLGKETLSTTPDLVFQGEANGDHMGERVGSLGDINNDTYPDFFISAPVHSSVTGKVYIYFGGGTVDNTADITILGENNNDYFGISVSKLGDVNGDKIDDFIIGAGEFGTNQGKAYIYYGSTNIPEISTSDLEILGEANTNHFAYSTAYAGDINQDGYNDILVGAEYATYYKGKAYLYYGGTAMDNIADKTFTGKGVAGVTKEKFGYWLSAGDIDNDKISDIIISSPDSSYVFVYKGEKNEIDIKQETTDIVNNSTFDFGKIVATQTKTLTFTIKNSGNKILNLTGTPIVSITGDGYSITEQPSANTISALGSLTFKVKLTTTTSKIHTGSITIQNDDSDESPFQINLTGEAINSTTYFSGSWSNGEPTSVISAIIDDDYNENTNIICNNLIINSGINFTLNNNTCATINGDITNNGNLSVQDEASLISTSENITGKYLANFNSGDWTFAASPVGSFLAANIFTSDYVYSYDESAATQTAAWINLTNTSQIQSGVGYLVRTPATNKIYNGIFGAGDFNSGAEFPALEYTNPHPTSGHGGFNLVGNPYPSYLDWGNPVGWTKTDLDVNKTVWIWNGTSYDFYTEAMGTLIPPAKSFFVQAASSSSVLGMTNNVRVCGTTPPKKQEKIENLLEISALGNSLSDRIVIYKSNIEAGSTKLLSWNESVPQIYIKGNDKNKSIQTLKNLDENKIFNLDFFCGKSGNYEIKLSKNSYPENLKIYIKDLKTNQTKELKFGDNYLFNYEKDEEKSRFVLSFKKGEMSVNDITEKSFSIFSGEKTIFIKRKNTEKVQIEIFDLTGRSVKTISTKDDFIKIENLKTGIYFVRLKTNTKNESQKIFVK